MKILVLNCGSSSIKFQIIDMESKNVIIKGVFERVGTPQSFVTLKWDDKKKIIEAPVKNHNEGIAVILKEIINPEIGKIQSLDEINAIGHRVVHAGEAYSDSVLITEDVKKKIIESNELAPLHNPANLEGINACEINLPGKPNVAVFDTAFHQTMPEVAYIYNIPYEYYENDRVRKYGFHGTSHKYITKRTAELVGKKPEDINIISCHIGQGASIAAVKAGKCIDTTMGLTPLAGVPMGTRSGDIDPSILLYLGKKYNMSFDDLDTMLNKKSGALGVSGVSADFRDIEDAAYNGNKRAILALESNAYNIAKVIASYIAVLGGVDVISFTAGVGENGPETREMICNYLKWFGIELDAEKNKVRGKEAKISKDSSRAEIWVVPTNEELMIALDTQKILND